MSIALVCEIIGAALLISGMLLFENLRSPSPQVWVREAVVLFGVLLVSSSFIVSPPFRLFLVPKELSIGETKRIVQPRFGHVDLDSVKMVQVLSAPFEGELHSKTSERSYVILQTQLLHLISTGKCAVKVDFNFARDDVPDRQVGYGVIDFGSESFDFGNLGKGQISIDVSGHVKFKSKEGDYVYELDSID